MTDEVRLKPCPFCGRPPKISPTDTKAEGDAWTKIFCACLVTPSVAVYQCEGHLESAMKIWNTRTPDSIGDKSANHRETLKLNYLTLDAFVSGWESAMGVSAGLMKGNEYVIIKYNAWVKRIDSLTNPQQHNEGADTHD